MMKKLTPEQASAVWESLADSVYEAERKDDSWNWLLEAFGYKLGQLTAKPGDEEFCGICEQWGIRQFPGRTSRWECLLFPSGTKPSHCPMVAGEEK